ncbi:MAG: hypothetical protein P8X75_14015, partial [Limibacillus sp.]
MIKSERTSYTDLLRFKSALEQVSGAEEWYRLKDNRSLATWKSSLQKALRMTAAAIEGTVAIADEDWLSRSKEILCQGKQDISKSHSIGDVIGSFAACYMLLSFNQIGFAPDRKGST